VVSISFLCTSTSLTRRSAISIDFNAHDHEETSDFGDTNCPDGLRAQIFFPSCWDGKNVDSPDHKSHMAYPSGINSGTCPDTHPVRLISLFYEIWHWVRPYNQLNDGGQFIMSTGDPTGHSLHGDFINGWDHTILQRVTDTCTNLSGVIEDCGVLQNENRFFTDDQMNACSAQNPYPEDEVSYGEVLKYLPGCVAVTSGPGDASPNDLVPGCKAAGVGTVGVGLSGDPAPNPSNSSSSMGPTSTPPTANPGPSSSMTSMSSAASGSPGYSDSPASSVTPATSGSQDYSDSPNPSTSPAASGSQGYSDSPNPSTSPAASGSQGYSDSPNSYTPPAASGSQGYSGSPIPPAWPTSSHDCGDHDHSAYPSSSMAPIRRHHKRGHASPRHF
jgi:hypothetical protein